MIETETTKENRLRMPFDVGNTKSSCRVTIVMKNRI